MNNCHEIEISHWDLRDIISWPGGAFRQWLQFSSGLKKEVPVILKYEKSPSRLQVLKVYRYRNGTCVLLKDLKGGENIIPKKPEIIEQLNMFVPRTYKARNIKHSTDQEVEDFFDEIIEAAK